MAQTAATDDELVARASRLSARKLMKQAIQNGLIAPTTQYAGVAS